MSLRRGLRRAAGVALVALAVPAAVPAGSSASGLGSSLGGLPDGSAGASTAALTPPHGAVRELEFNRTSRSTTWERADGSRVTKIAGQPIRWRDRTGRWRAYDVNLRSRGSSLETIAGPVS